jgi:hypothetical protein
MKKENDSNFHLTCPHCGVELSKNKTQAYFWSAMKNCEMEDPPVVGYFDGECPNCHHPIRIVLPPLPSFNINET